MIKKMYEGFQVGSSPLTACHVLQPQQLKDMVPRSLMTLSKQIHTSVAFRFHHLYAHYTCCKAGPAVMSYTSENQPMWTMNEIQFS